MQQMITWVRRHHIESCQCLLQCLTSPWHAQDELRPITCGGHDSQGGIAITLIDALDSLIVFGEVDALQHAVKWINQSLDLNLDARVHVFELTIRALGEQHCASGGSPTCLGLRAVPDCCCALYEAAVRQGSSCTGTAAGVSALQGVVGDLLVVSEAMLIPAGDCRWTAVSTSSSDEECQLVAGLPRRPAEAGN